MITAYLLATLVGLSLGLMGGGGSILTVPILVYVIGMEAKLAVASSLVVVGATSLIGSISHFRAGNLNIKTGTIFGSVAMFGAFVTARFFAKYLSGTTQLILFAIIMLLASYYMLKKKKVIEGQMEETVHLPILKIAGLGLVVGIVTGLVGVGSGFLIVPALHLMARVPMKQAVGTSLVIIAANSFSGYLGYMNQVHLDWNFIGMFILFTAIGIIIGSWLVKFVPADKLKKAFGVFLIIMGLFILYKERAKMGIAYLPTQIGRTLA